MRILRAVLLSILLAGPLAPHAPAYAQGQAATVQQPRAPRFEKDIAAYEAEDRMSPPAPGGVVFIGSSSIRLWKTLAEDFPELNVLNRGFGGSVLSESVHYAPRIVLPYKPKMVVLYAGSNDIHLGVTPAQVRKDFEAFVKVIHASLPDTRIVYVTINPSVSRWSEADRVLEANGLIEAYIREKSAEGVKLAYVDSYSKLLSPDGKPRPELLRADGLHLNAEGYAAWLAILKPQLMELVARDKG
ncbi:MAG: GDSL-type esterase/lipase family protein [Actinomycetota bacterium]